MVVITAGATQAMGLYENTHWQSWQFPQGSASQHTQRTRNLPTGHGGLALFPEGWHFLAGLVRPQATLLPGRKGAALPTLALTGRHYSWGEECCHSSCGTSEKRKGLTPIHL